MKIVRLNEADDVIAAKGLREAETNLTTTNAQPLTDPNVIDGDELRRASTDLTTTKNTKLLDDPDVIDTEFGEVDPDSEDVIELDELSFKLATINNELALVPVVKGQTLRAELASPNEVQALIADGGPPLFPPTQAAMDSGAPLLTYKSDTPLPTAKGKPGQKIKVVPKAVSLKDIIGAEIETPESDDLFRQAYQKTMEIMNSNMAGREGIGAQILSLFGPEFDSIDDPFTKKIRQLGNKLADKISQWRSKSKNEALTLIEADQDSGNDKQEEFMFYRQVCKRIYVRLLIKAITDHIVEMLDPKYGLKSEETTRLSKQLSDTAHLRTLTSEMLKIQEFDQHVSQKFAEVTGGQIDRRPDPRPGVVSDLDNKTRVGRGGKSTFKDTAFQNWLAPMQNAVDMALKAKGRETRDKNTGLPIVDVGAILTSSNGPDLAEGELISFAQAWGVPNMTADSPITDLFVSGKVNVTTTPKEFLKLYNKAVSDSGTTDDDGDDKSTAGTTSATPDSRRVSEVMAKLERELRAGKSSNNLDALLKQVNKLLTDTGNQEYRDLQREIQRRLGL